MTAEFVDGVRHKLENIISGHRINQDDADWLRAIFHRTVSSRALSAPDNAEADDLDSFIAKQPQHIQEATERRYRELSADNAEAVCPNCDRLTEIRHCQACGCDFANLAPPRIEPITCQTFRHDVGKVDFNPCGECNTEPVKEISLSRVSGQDIDQCEDIAKWIEEGDKHVLNSTDAAAIRRLVQAVKGEG